MTLGVRDEAGDPHGETESLGENDHELELPETRYRARGTFALAKTRLILRPGINFLLGANGSGKSTLIGVAVRRTNSPGNIAYLPQDHRLPGSAKVKSYLDYAAWAQGVDGLRRKAAIEDAVERTDLSGDVDTRIRRLSGGTQRRVAIAGSLLATPELLFLDEPGAGLDPAHRQRITQQLSTWNRPIVLATHHIDDVLEAWDSSSLILLRKGRVVYSGASSDFAPADSDRVSRLIEIMGGT